MAGERYRHIFLQGVHSARAFTSPRQRGREPRIPVRNRAQHSAHLAAQLADTWAKAEERQAVAHVERHGVYVDFVSDPGCDLMLKSLEARPSGIRLLNVRKEGAEETERTLATVYVPNAKRGHFLRKITRYADEDTRYGKPKNQKCVESIGDIKVSVLESFWLDSTDLLPGDDSEWVEVWLNSNTDEVVERFNALVQAQNIQRAEGVLVFPERAVEVIKASRAQLEALIEMSDDIAEFRKAKDVATILIEISNQEQLERVRELLARTQIDDDTDVSVCILDTGVNNGHLLVAPVLSDEDRHSVRAAWGVNDDQGHGTKMAGLAAYGDLLAVLQSDANVVVSHKLESAKILPPQGQNDPELWGHVTAQGIHRAEIQAPERKRIVCLAVTSTDFRDLGRPSSWSAKLDELASGPEDGSRRLLIVSAGNVDEQNEWMRYSDANMTNEVHDPGQSWNALTVGAYTEKVAVTDPTLAGYNPVAPLGGLSPFSTTSLDWQRMWPIKPEVLFEGGNVAVSPNGSVNTDELGLVSTSHEPTVAQFVPFGMTSAAAAQASWMAARIQRQYPDAWPETIRALIVHSANWTETMRQQFLDDETKGSYNKLLRICGYGVPNMTDALYCADNSLTLVSQAELQPFDKRGSQYVSRDMHSYSLPWPNDVLMELGEIDVKMRVTLSYFVEPGPGEVGWRDRYRYASYALRFAVNGPSENEEEFMIRVNAMAREEGESPGTTGPTDKWVIGENTRNVGSIHSDIWSGSAADLAASNQMAVFPAIGWWRERHHLERWNQKCRYSLVVSIHTPPETVDIYTPVAQKVGIVIPVTV